MWVPLGPDGRPVGRVVALVASLSQGGRWCTAGHETLAHMLSVGRQHVAAELARAERVGILESAANGPNRRRRYRVADGARAAARRAGRYAVMSKHAVVGVGGHCAEVDGEWRWVMRRHAEVLAAVYRELARAERVGERPTRAALAARVGQTEQTVKRALRTLREDGWIAARPGGGHRVAGAPLELVTADDVQDGAAAPEPAPEPVADEVVHSPAGGGMTATKGGSPRRQRGGHDGDTYIEGDVDRDVELGFRSARSVHVRFARAAASAPQAAAEDHGLNSDGDTPENVSVARTRPDTPRPVPDTPPTPDRPSAARTAPRPGADAAAPTPPTPLARTGGAAPTVEARLLLARLPREYRPAGLPKWAYRAILRRLDAIIAEGLGADTIAYLASRAEVMRPEQVPVPDLDPAQQRPAAARQVSRIHEALARLVTVAALGGLLCPDCRAPINAADRCPVCDPREVLAVIDCTDDDLTEPFGGPLEDATPDETARPPLELVTPDTPAPANAADHGQDAAERAEDERRARALERSRAKARAMVAARRAQSEHGYPPDA